MRSIFRMISLGFLVCLATGCESTRWNWLKRDASHDAPPKNAAATSPTVVNLVSYLNNNAERVRTLKVDDMSIDASMDNQSFGIRGRILAEKPRNFRMKATAFGKDEADIGSNAQEFWFWVARNPDRHQYFCKYKDLQEGKVRMMPLPIQPEWVMETMGLGPYGPADKYQLEQDAGTLRLVERARSPQGYAVRKVIVMNRNEVRSPQPQVMAFLLLDDASGQEICSAHITSTVIDRATGAILPYKMELRMPAQRMKLAMKMDGLTVNTAIQNTTFLRQPVAGAEPFNLATDRLEPGVQRVQGFKK